MSYVFSETSLWRGYHRPCFTHEDTKVRESESTSSLLESVGEPGSTQTIAERTVRRDTLSGCLPFVKITQLTSFLGIDQAWVLRCSFEQWWWLILVHPPCSTDLLAQPCVSKEAAGGGKFALWSPRWGQKIAPRPHPPLASLLSCLSQLNLTRHWEPLSRGQHAQWACNMAHGQSRVLNSILQFYPYLGFYFWNKNVGFMLILFRYLSCLQFLI